MAWPSCQEGTGRGRKLTVGPQDWWLFPRLHQAGGYSSWSLASFGGRRSFSISIAGGLGQGSSLRRYEGGCFGVAASGG